NALTATFVGTRKQIIGSDAATVLSRVLPAVVSGLRGEKNMRWNAPGMSFCRPIRWIVALLGTAVVPFTVSSLSSGRVTQLHRQSPVTGLTVERAEGYLELLESKDILVDAAARRAQIEQASVALASEVGGRVDLEAEAGLIGEITQLVEQPVPLLAAFDERYLGLPRDVLTTVMRKHQRYLPVLDTEGELLPQFIAVGNGQRDDNVVRAGNEAVLSARYEDAAFFFTADLKRSVDDMIAQLSKLTFAEHLGSVADRAGRIRVLSGEIARLVGDSLNEADWATLRRAGELAKFDLSSQMVTELPSLAGVMAREYALRAGETPAVATALVEMELPRSGGGTLPATLPGALLALADRLDLLAGLFAVGATPTGSSDPFGMRRAALGVVNILIAHPALRAVTVSSGLRLAATAQPVAVSGVALAEAAEFVHRRLTQHLLDA
ncbi:MAG: glycine--tRNA ligase subunit beta, partial [Mycobacteriales bacterium]